MNTVYTCRVTVEAPAVGASWIRAIIHNDIGAHFEIYYSYTYTTAIILFANIIFYYFICCVRIRFIIIILLFRDNIVCTSPHNIALCLYITRAQKSCYIIYVPARRRGRRDPYSSECDLNHPVAFVSPTIKNHRTPRPVQ